MANRFDNEKHIFTPSPAFYRVISVAIFALIVAFFLMAVEYSGRSTIENKLHTIVGPGVERSGHSTTLGAGDMRSDDRLIRSHCPVRGDSIGLIIIALIERLPIELKAHEERVPIAEPLDGDGSLC